MPAVRASCLVAGLWALAAAEPLERALLGKRQAPAGSGEIAARGAGSLECSAKPSCEACLAEGSGCYGWFGDECCAEQDCKMAMAGDRMFYRSCAEWQKMQRKAEVCSAVPANDACACLRAGCVAQEAGGGVACFSEFQGAAGRTAKCADAGLSLASSSATAVQGEFCEGSPEQLCRMLCPQVRCAPGHCLMRHGPCCDLSCQPRA